MSNKDIDIFNAAYIDDIIDKYKVIEKTGMTREELHKQIFKATTCMSLAYMLTDVADSLLMDADSIFKPFRISLKFQERMQLNKVGSSIAAARRGIKELTGGIYRSQGDAFATDADWWYNAIRLLHDRTGESLFKTRQVLEWLINMPSEMNMFTKITLKDFANYEPRNDKPINDADGA